MTEVAAFLARRWAVSLLGTLALGLLVWYAGDLVQFGERVPLASSESRALAIAGLFVVWALAQITSAVRARGRDKGLVEGLTEASPSETASSAAMSAAEQTALEERFREAFRLLKGRQARRRLGGRRVSQLPWYLIIGPPGCGKTTALINSGLSFPLAEHLHEGPVQGIGGTRNCDWWLTKDAVLIDTAGRYTTQDSYEQIDRSAWEGFLKLLKRYRPRRPVNGVLVAISLSDLLQQTEPQREAQAQAIALRLQELQDAFETRLPVYLLVMKADLIAGFMEYFSDLGKEGREQVWGFTLPLEPQGGSTPAIGHLDGELGTLLENLTLGRNARMERESDPAKRALIFAFPQQLAALKAPLAAFVGDAFAPHRYRTPPMLRGLYLTSGTQTGTPIDRVLATMAASVGFAGAGQQPYKGSGRSYFLTQLFRELVIPEAGLAGYDPRLARRRRRRYALGLFGILALTGLAAGAWTAAYLRSEADVEATKRAIGDIETQLAALDPSEKNPAALLPLLDRARAMPARFANRDRLASLLSGLGLDQRNKLQPTGERAYRRALNKTLLPLLMIGMEDQIRRASGDPEQLYGALRAYLMLDDRARFDARFLRNRMGRVWGRELTGAGATERQREALKDHLQALLAEAPSALPFPLSSALIEGARRILTEEPLAERLYDHIKGEELGSGGAELTMAAMAGDYASLVFERRSGRSLGEGVPALYTYDGYHNGFLPRLKQLALEAAEEISVLNPEAQSDPGSEPVRDVLRDVRRLYLSDYVKTWDKLLEDVDLIPPRDLRHAAEIARILADPEHSPLRRLLTSAKLQTALDRRAQEAQPGGVDEAVAVTGSRDRRNRSASHTAAEAPKHAHPPLEAQAAEHFRWLRALMEPTGDQAAPIDRAEAALDRAHLLLKSMAIAASTGRGALAAGVAGAISDLSKAAEGLPAPLSGLLARLAQDSSDIFSGTMRAQLNRLWITEILPFCRASINDRYPFEARSTREAALPDFARLLGPDGLLAAFFDANLAQLVDTSKTPWTWNDPEIGIPKEALEQFQRAARIRQAFFPDEGELPSAAMELVPLSLDSRSQAFILALGTQRIRYQSDSLEPHKWAWPAPETTGRAGIGLVDQIGLRPGLSYSGPWAWFRLLEAAQLAATDKPDVYRLAFSLAGHEARFELRAAGEANPFQLDELRKFRCPDRL